MKVNVIVKIVGGSVYFHAPKFQNLKDWDNICKLKGKSIEVEIP
jgi:hypothetical protein